MHFILAFLVHRPQRLALLALLALSAAACDRGTYRLSGDAAEAPAAAVGRTQPACPPEASGDKVRILPVRREDDREVIKLAPDPDLGGEASVVSRIDLNADGHPDLILRFFALCGNYGECPFAAYAGCGGDQYVVVRAPDYASALQVQPRRGAPWAELSETVRKSAGGKDAQYQRTLRFDNGAYRAVPTSETRAP